MGRIVMMEGGDAEPKAKLVNEICFIAAAFSSCTHLGFNARKVFVDWYLILQVDENSGLDLIRRRYRQLALQVHPDKNKHPKAEVAFKLISEAYACLSDQARRKRFNIERKSSFCKDCYLSWKSGHHENPNHTKIGRNSNNNNNNKDIKNPKPRRQSSVELLRQHKIMLKMKQLRNKFREECQVIENCLKASRNTTGRESPLFDPCDPDRFPNYPYQRAAATKVTKISPGYCSFQTHKIPLESPVFHMRSDCWARRAAEPLFSQV